MQHRDEATPCPEGEPVLFALSFTNEYSYGEKYYVGIEGLEKGSREFILVSNAVEWEFYCKEKGYDAPSRFNIIDEATQSLYLLPHEAVTLLLKFQTFRKSRSQRELKCVVCDSRSQMIAKASFKIVPTEPRIDHIFRLYDFIGGITQLDIPFSQPLAYKTPTVFSVQPDLKYVWAKKNTSVTLKVALSKKQQFMVYIYSDERLSKLLLSYRIELNAYPECRFQNSAVGLQHSSKFELSPLAADTEVRFATSDSSKCWTDIQGDHILKADTINFLTVTVRSFRPARTQNLLVNCIRTSDSAVLFQWLVRLQTAAPSYQSVQEVLCSTVRETPLQLQINNPKSKKATLGIVSSNLSLLQVVRNKRELHAHETVSCELTILPREESEREVVVVVSDRQQTIFLSYLIKLHYSKDFKEDEPAN